MALHRAWLRVQKGWHAVKHILEIVLLWSLQQLIVVVVAAPIVFLACRWAGVTVGLRALLPPAAAAVTAGVGEEGNILRMYELYNRMPAPGQRFMKGKGGI